MFICLDCKSVFDEPDERIIDRQYGEYGNIPKCVCPECGSTEITEAFECTECGEFFPADERNYHPYTELDICDDCYYGITNAYKSSPYHDCDDVYSVLDAMIGA